MSFLLAILSSIGLTVFVEQLILHLCYACLCVCFIFTSCILCYSFGQYKKMRKAIDMHEGGLDLFSRGYEKMGFTRRYYLAVSVVLCPCFIFSSILVHL